jgi:hypothetical protein
MGKRKDMRVLVTKPELPGKARGRWEENIKMNHKETVCESVN